jgi:peroxiredoxin
MNIKIIKMKNSIVLCILLLNTALISAHEKSGGKQFFLDGTIKGITDGVIYIRYADASGEYKNDSSVVKDGHFRLNGRTNEPAIAFLTTVKKSLPEDDDKIVSADGKNAVLFFLEPTSIHVELEAANFKSGLFTGSSSQVQFAAFNAQMEQVKNQSPLDQQEETNILHRFIEQHPDSYVSAYLVTCHHFVLDTLRSYYGRFTTKVKHSANGKAILENIHKRELVVPGRQAPAFTQDDMNGKPVSLKDFRGKYVLLEFWESWMNACRIENQYLLKAYNQYNNKNFTIVGVSLDGQKTKKTWLAAIEKDSLSWTQLVPLKGKDNPVAIKYCVETLPANFLVDPAGRIIATDLRGEALGEELKKVIKTP